MTRLSFPTGNRSTLFGSRSPVRSSGFDEITLWFENEPVGAASIGFQPLNVSVIMAALSSFSDILVAV
jgi:hypothetical protein